ncbi:MAG: serine/threonine-protein kinase [Myxococcota bacterium]
MSAPIEKAPPPTLGRYRIASKIAAGGMASVYMARASHARGLEQIVALKVIHSHLAAQSSFSDMFLDEASLASALVHPNICSVFDFGEDDGVLYMAMEYLAGESLARLGRRVAHRRKRKEIKALATFSARIVAEACEGLHAAHELRAADGTPLEVVHRDVSPENILVTYDGAVKIIDFGVAKAAQRVHETKVAKIKGKFAYVAPEQLRNEPLDRRTDVWGLGVCLWESLVLRRLFRRDTEASTLTAVLFDEIERPSDVRPWIPRSIDPIVMKALARDPNDRYDTAAELGRDLRAWLAEQKVVVGMPELGAWMKELFAEERQQRLDRIRRATEGEVDEDLDLGEISQDATMPSVSFQLTNEDVSEAARRAAEPTIRLKREVLEVDGPSDDLLIRDIRGRRWIPLTIIALITAGLLSLFHPAVRQAIVDRIDPPPEPVLEPDPEPTTTAAVFTLETEGAALAAFEGRAPLTVSGVRPGAVSFYVVGDVSRLVTTAADWGGAELELAVDLSAEAPTAELSLAEDGEGFVRIVTNPPGAKVYRVVGRAPEVNLPALARGRAHEFMAFAPNHVDERVVIDRESLEADSVTRTVTLQPVD